MTEVGLAYQAGRVEPLTVVDPFAAVLTDGLGQVPGPVWTPWPVPDGWRLSGVGFSPDATVTSWLGPSPLAGFPVEALLIADEPGSDVGSWFAGLPSRHVRTDVVSWSPYARFEVEGHHTPLWWVPDAKHDRAAYVGEFGGQWLWVVIHPAAAGTLVADSWTLVDARELGPEMAVVPVAELSARLLVEPGFG